MEVFSVLLCLGELQQFSRDLPDDLILIVISAAGHGEFDWADVGLQFLPFEIGGHFELDVDHGVFPVEGS